MLLIHACMQCCEGYCGGGLGQRSYITSTQEGTLGWIESVPFKVQGSSSPFRKAQVRISSMPLPAITCARKHVSYMSLDSHSEGSLPSIFHDALRGV